MGCHQRCTGPLCVSHARPAPRRVQAGELVRLDAGCCVGGDYSDFARSGVVGEPTAEQSVAQAAIHEITMRGVAMVRPGALGLGHRARFALRPLPGWTWPSP